MVADFDSSANRESEGYLPKPKGINMIRLDVVIINREGPSCAVLSEMEKDQAVLRFCCIPLTRHLAMKVGFVDSPMRMALCISLVLRITIERNGLLLKA